MTSFKIIVDTNVVIELEDARQVTETLAELVRASSQYGVRLFVDGANYDDVARDRDAARRAITLSKLDKFERLQSIPLPSEAELVRKFGPIKSENDRSDIRLLAILDYKAVDFLVTQDMGLHKRASRCGKQNSVLTVEDALQWLRQTFAPKSIALPYVTERKAYAFDTSDPIFASLRNDYEGFDEWFDKCRAGHRDCWSLEIGNQIAGIVIRKSESYEEAKTLHPGPRILKVCTFKVRDEYRGEKFGELLLKQVLWFAQKNQFDLVYLTAFPKHEFLVSLLQYYGFQQTLTLANGEFVMEKPMFRGALPSIGANLFESQRRIYPRYFDGDEVQKFCVPIQPDYHQRLFPEVGKDTPLPLFPGYEPSFKMLQMGRDTRTPGNTIRKVYLCRAKTKQMRPGDLLLFYASKRDNYAASQCITTIAILEQISVAESFEDLVRITAKRSVFAEQDLMEMVQKKDTPVIAIDFILIGHLSNFVRLSEIKRLKIFGKGAPQSIARITPLKFDLLKAHLTLGFDT
jgi:GNAT superfamily N-acetyltransferase